MGKKCRVIAFYLPQFYPIPENDEWWGKGFTEWRNVAAAKPLFKNHYQPKIPGELGFYDLRLPETRKAQAEMASSCGIEGFCYWHYWFGNGKTLLDRPFKEVLNSKQPDFPFCLAWANISWGGLPYGDLYERNLIEQKYPGVEDYKEHFNYILPAFKDNRYIKINGRPLFVVYNPTGLPNAKEFIDAWNRLSLEEGLGKIYFVAYQHFDYNYKEHGFDALIPPVPSHIFNRIVEKRNRSILYRILISRFKEIKRKILSRPVIFKHKEIVEVAKYDDVPDDVKFFPNVMPNWDHTPRSGSKGTLIVDPDPMNFSSNLENCFDRIKNNSDEEKIIFVKAWNEWAEGNYLEPDLKHGRSFLNKLKEFVYN